MLILYAVAMFASAALLFMVQPMFAKMALPLLGGSPAVWNTAVVFYQVTLLAGYVYAHLTTTRLGVRRQALAHVVLLALPLLVLPIKVPAGWSPPAEANPIPWLLALLLVAVGLPFFVLSTASPVLQAWFASTGHRAAEDPYFLYAASNVGSLLGLLGYPFLLEQHLRLEEQGWLWTAGYGLAMVLALACAATVWRSRASGERPASRSAKGRTSFASNLDSSEISIARRARWLLYAFVPSSLMLSVTTYLSTRIAAVPMLWIIPLAFYLLTFTFVFVKRRPIFPAIVVRALPILILPLIITIVTRTVRPTWLLLPLHLIVFSVVALACHGALAKDRPSKEHLTEFYLWLSVGGALGGVFNALLAPLLFETVLEYPLLLAAASALPLLPGDAPQEPRSRKLDLALPVALGLLTGGLILILRALGSRYGRLSPVVMLVPPAILCLGFLKRPLRFGLGVGAIALAGLLFIDGQGQTLHVERSFFGVHRVQRDAGGRYHVLTHGATLHGAQSLDPENRCAPLLYYYPTGPIGQVMAVFNERGADQRVAVAGLGAGSLAGYGREGQRWTFYEIDPAVERIARDPRLFTYLRDCGSTAEVVLGDARLSLAQAPDRHYHLLILDTYNSDSIPVHLLTREALALYVDKLDPHGLIAFHITNPFFDFGPVLAALAKDADLACLKREDLDVSAEERARGKKESQWVVMARDAADLAHLAADPRWEEAKARPGTEVWSDDFSSVLSALR